MWHWSRRQHTSSLLAYNTCHCVVTVYLSTAVHQRVLGEPWGVRGQAVKSQFTSQLSRAIYVAVVNLLAHHVHRCRSINFNITAALKSGVRLYALNTGAHYIQVLLYLILISTIKLEYNVRPCKKNR